MLSGSFFNVKFTWHPGPRIYEGQTIYFVKRKEIPRLDSESGPKPGLGSTFWMVLLLKIEKFLVFSLVGLEHG